eukprot:scaffold675677_cov179-Prasinocladus_malaysianus.AAC.1
MNPDAPDASQIVCLVCKDYADASRQEKYWTFKPGQTISNFKQTIKSHLAGVCHTRALKKQQRFDEEVKGKNGIGLNVARQ